MNPRFILLLSFAAMTPLTLPAQETALAAPAPQPAPARFTPGQLDQLLGPIALYPDALIAVILPASVSPSDIVLAARYLQGGGDPAQLDNQLWDDSVAALAHYPDIIKWMDENLAWTKQLGEAFDAQPADVMRAVQRLRGKARAAGTLANSPEQQVIVEGTDTIILQARPDVIFVPRYDPDLVYLAGGTNDFAGPYLTFGDGFAAGAWLSYDADWEHHQIWVNERHGLPGRRDGQPPVVPGQPGHGRDPGRHPWSPATNHNPALPQPPRPAPSQVALPAPLPGAPLRPNPALREDQPDRHVALPPGQAASFNNGIRPNAIQSPLPQPLTPPLSRPLQAPLAQPLRPAAPDLRTAPEQTAQRGREAPTAPAPAVRQAPPAAPAPAPASTEDEKKRQ